MVVLNDKLEPLLKKAKQQEKKYEWLQAAKFYKKASDFNIKDKDTLNLAKLQEQIGFCYFKAAFQSQSNNQFKKRIKQAILIYKKATSLFQNTKDIRGVVKADNSKAMVAYIKSWLEVDVSKKSVFLEEWWTLKSKLLEFHKREGNQLAIARTCNDMMEGSADCLSWLESNWKNTLKKRETLTTLGEKTIIILSKERDNYELARAYCWTSFYYVIGVAGQEKNELTIRKALTYAKKALELSQKIGDAWLIGWSYHSLARGLLHEDEFKTVLEYYKYQIMQGEITKDNYLLGVGKFLYGLISFLTTFKLEDPDKNRKIIERNVQVGQEVLHHFQLINIRVWNSYYLASISLVRLASKELNLEEKRSILRKAVDYGRKSVEELQGFVSEIVPNILNAYSLASYKLSEVETNSTKKRQLLNEVLNNTIKSSKILQSYPYDYFFKAYNQTWIALANSDISMITIDKKKKIFLLKNASTAIETCIKIVKIDLEKSMREWKTSRYGDFFYRFGNIYCKLFSLTQEKNLLHKAIEVYEDAISLFTKVELMTRVAEAYWQKAKTQNQLEEHLNAAKDYKIASETYLKAAEKIPQLKEFYENHALYMQAWNRIEQARYNHFREDYSQAMIHYGEAASLHEKTKSWSYLTPNYYAWQQLEKGENLSRKEEPSEAIQSFHLAIEYFKKSEDSIKKKFETLKSKEEKKLAANLIIVSGLRGRYCHARISLEEAKVFDKHGEYSLSSKSYGKAAESLCKIINELESEEEKTELRLIMFLSQAWEKMALAEEHASPEFYLKASQLFVEAKKYSPNKKTTMLILGNSSFCKGLAAGIDYQSSLDLKDHAKAKSLMKSAAIRYLQAGFKTASEYAKATQRLFEAYVFMNQTESEVDQEKRAKKYRMAENLLQISAGSFMKAKQPEKTAQVQRILETVREERNLAISLNEILHTPAIASTTLSFTTPTPAREVSIGLESFEHANVQANLITHVKEVKVGESFCISIEFVNAGKEPALLTRVEEFIPPNFVVVEKPEMYRLEDTCLNMKGKQLAPLNLVEAKLVLQPSKKGVFQLKPQVHYLDELGQTKSLELKSIEIKVKEVILSDRVSTGTKELDSLLLGGIPEEYAVVLTGSPSDEREHTIQNFLEEGTKKNQTTFNITTEAAGLDKLLEKSNFHLFLCNSKPKTQVPDQPNITKLKGKTDLNNLNIALIKTQRNIKQTSTNKRICVDIVSDVLLDYGAKVTRKWISELITDLTSKGFTILAVMDPSMHPSDQANAVLNLFDGEINITQTDDPLECKKSIQVKKLRGQDYIKNPICLTKQKR